MSIRRISGGTAAKMREVARIALPKVDAAGVYAWLLKREEGAARAPGSVLAGQFGGEVPWSYNYVPTRLEALQAGHPVNVPFGSLPGWAKNGAPARRGAFGLATIYPARAIVHSNDTLSWSDDDWARLWLDENGL
jgi:hypothetical protein